MRQALLPARLRGPARRPLSQSGSTLGYHAGVNGALNVIAHGIDLVEVARIERMAEEHEQRFLARVFTPGEREFARGSRRRMEHLAARFAAKEAVIKALGTGWTRGIGWTDVEVVRAASGRPGIRLGGMADAIAQEQGIASWLVSLSHTSDLAMASVIAMAGPIEGGG